MHPVRIFHRATFGYAAPAGAYWQAIASDGLRLYIPGGSAAMPIDLRASSPTTFTGTTMIANRPISVTLKRLTDCPAR